MPGLQRQLLNQDMGCQKQKKKSDFAEEAKIRRKIRVICHDPDATDSSSEDEDIKYEKTDLKRVICEIKVPVKSIPNDFERESFSQDHNTKTKPRRRATRKAMKSPSKNTVVLQKSNSLSVSCVSEDSEPFFSLSSPSSVLDVSTPASLINGLDNPSKGEINTTKSTEPRSVFLEQPLIPLEFDSFMEDLVVLEEDFVGMEDLPLYENDLSAMNFDLDGDSLAWLNL